MSEVAMTVDVWALVELMGRTRVAGRISEAQQFGATVMRVDIPDSDGQAASVHYYQLGAIFGWHVVDEETARDWAERLLVPGVLPTFPGRPALAVDAYVDPWSADSYDSNGDGVDDDADQSGEGDPF